MTATDLHELDTFFYLIEGGIEEFVIIFGLFGAYCQLF